MPACHSRDQRGIRFAEIFHHDSENCVTDEKEAGQHPIRLAHARSHKPQNAKQNDALEERFVELRRVPRRQDRPESVSDGRLVMNRGDDGVGRLQGRVNLDAGGDRAIGLLGMVEQLLRKLHRPGHGRGPTVELAINEISAATKE